MHSEVEENYVFHRFADANIFHALKAVGLVKTIEPIFAKYAVLRDLVVTYIRPFTPCFGKFQKYKLEDELIPEEFLDLHKELYNLRCQVFAHTDLRVRNPVLHCWVGRNGTMFPITFKGYDYEGLLKKIDPMEPLFSKVLEKVRKRMFELEDQLNNLIPKK